MKTKLQIINETAAFYGADPSRRGLDDDGGCVYKATVKGVVKHCAVGRCLLKPSARSNGPVLLVFDGRAGLDENLKPEYQGHPLSFWADLQNWHDNERNFTKTGLSDRGKKILRELKETYRK